MWRSTRRSPFCLNEGEKASDIKAEVSRQRLLPSREQPEKPASEKRRGRLAEKPRRRLRRKGNGRVFASPLARRIAKEKGIDLAALSGSGPHGRIVLKDVEVAKPGQVAPAAKAAAERACGAICCAHG